MLDPMVMQVVLSILRDAGYDQTDVMTDADVVLVNTCAIREGAAWHDESDMAGTPAMTRLTSLVRQAVSLLCGNSLQPTESLLMTGAEQKIWAWLGSARSAILGGDGGHQTRWQRRQAHARRPVLGVLGCMAERLKGGQAPA